MLPYGITPQGTYTQYADSLVLYASINDIGMVKKLLTVIPRVPIDARDKDGRTALHVAAAEGLLRMCKYLLRRGADPNAQTLTGQTPLHFAVAAARNEKEPGDCAAVARLLIAEGADTTLPNASGLPPLRRGRAG